jgi:hypothetical protein
MAVQFMILHTPLGTSLGAACNIIFFLPLIQTQRSYLAFLTPWISPLNYPMEASNCSPDLLQVRLLFILYITVLL